MRGCEGYGQIPSVLALHTCTPAVRGGSMTMGFLVFFFLFFLLWRKSATKYQFTVGREVRWYNDGLSVIIRV